VSHEIPISPGRCRLGNWFAQGRVGREASRSLSGLVDELAVWSRALSETEMASLTESGRPSLVWTRENPQLKVPLPKY
jgi:hypothetical protein